jgi:hypothetical protein
MRGSIRSRQKAAPILLLGSVAVHGLRATDPSREFAGHRSLPASDGQQVISSGDSRWGLAFHISRSTLADANAGRDWRVYADLAHILIAIARPLYAHEPFGVDLADTVYALDATTIDVCLSLSPWAPFQKSRGAVKMHALLDLRGSIPTFIDITHGRCNDLAVLDQLAFEAGAFYVMDRGYLHFQRLFRLSQSGAFFVTRADKNTQYR